MRRLMITTALASLAMVPAAHAGLEITLSGYTDVEMAYFDNDVANGSNSDFQSESEIHVDAKGTADNGLTYGAYIEMQASTSDTVNSDEVNLYLQGNWGRVELGDQDGAGSVLAVQTPSIGIGQVNGSYNDFVPVGDRGYRNSESMADSFLKPIDTADATKVTYYTPKISGFQAGVSYAPERDSQADGEGVQFSKTTGNHDDALELGLKYEGEFNNVGVKVSGNYDYASAKTGSGLEDISAWGLGAALTYQGFSFGGTYYDNGDSGLATGVSKDNVTGWALGGTYESGNWGVGASYVKVDFDTNGTPFDIASTGSGGDYQAYGLGGTYKVAPGLTASADLMFFDRNRDTGTDTNGYVLVTEVKAAF